MRHGGGARRREREESGLCARDVNESAHRRHPESARAVSRQRHRRSGKAVFDRPHLETAVGEVSEPRRHAEPESAGRVLVQVSDALARESLFLSEQRQLPVADVRETLPRSDPQCAVATLDERRDGRALERRAVADGFEAALPAAREPGQRPDPERAVTGLGEALHPVVFERGRVARVEDGEAHAVESGEPLLRAEPEVPVAALKDRLHGVLRKSGVAVEDVLAVRRVARLGLEDRRPRTDSRRKAALSTHRRVHLPDDRTPFVTRLSLRGRGPSRRGFFRRANPGRLPDSLQAGTSGAKPPMERRFRRTVGEASIGSSSQRVDSNPRPRRNRAACSFRRPKAPETQKFARAAGARSRNRVTIRPSLRSGAPRSELLRLAPGDRQGRPRRAGRVLAEEHDLPDVMRDVRETADGSRGPPCEALRGSGPRGGCRPARARRGSRRASSSPSPTRRAGSPASPTARARIPCRAGGPASRRRS